MSRAASPLGAGRTPAGYTALPAAISNRHWMRLEIAVTRRKQSPDLISNRHKNRLSKSTFSNCPVGSVPVPPPRNHGPAAASSSPKTARAAGYSTEDLATMVGSKDHFIPSEAAMAEIQP